MVLWITQSFNMGEENSASDCSWKKIVIAKTNNEWVSTIKTKNQDEQTNNWTVNIKSERLDTPEDTKSFSLNNGETTFKCAKRNRDLIISGLYQNPNVKYEAFTVEVDPLSTAPKRTRRIRRNSLDNETPIERASRLAKMSAYAAQRLANETPEQRASRLKRMSEYAAKRLAEETNEQRARRLARMSAYAAKRLADETPEQRKARLTRMSAYAARRQAMKKLGNINTNDLPSAETYYNSQITDIVLPNQS